LSLYILDNSNGKDDAIVYILTVGNRISIKYSNLEDLFVWLFKKTHAMTLRDAICLGWMDEQLSNEDKEKLKIVKKLYSACIDGVIKPKINIFCLYEDIAELMADEIIPAE